MYSRLRLREKNENTVVYFYGVDKKDAPSDGEIEFDIKADTFKTLKRATGDDDGYHAKWLFGHLRTVILKEGCPEKRVLAIG